jgi:L-ascorbate metabolism protein UlaG (beta-lactamase superfamily)
VSTEAPERPGAVGAGRAAHPDPGAAVEAARILDPAIVVPVHQDGWAHFTSGPEELEQAFAAAGLEARLRPVAPGETVGLGPG